MTARPPFPPSPPPFPPPSPPPFPPPFPPPHGAAGPPVPAKPWYKQWWTIVGGIALVVLLVCCCCVGAVLMSQAGETDSPGEGTDPEPELSFGPPAPDLPGLEDLPDDPPGTRDGAGDQARGLTGLGATRDAWEAVQGVPVAGYARPSRP